MMLTILLLLAFYPCTQAMIAPHHCSGALLYTKLLKAKAACKEQKAGRHLNFYSGINLKQHKLGFAKKQSGLVLGITSTKRNSNTKGIIGIVTGAVILLLFLLAVIVLAALLSGGPI